MRQRNLAKQISNFIQFSVCLSAILFASSLLAQDASDPFGGSRSIDQDPFKPRAQDPFKAKTESPEERAQKMIQKADEAARLAEKANDIEKLKKANREILMALQMEKSRHQNAMRQVLEELQAATVMQAQLQERLKRIDTTGVYHQAKDDYVRKAYLGFIAQMLASPEPANQFAGLKHIRDSHLRASEEGIAHNPVNHNIRLQLRKLVESSDKKVQSAAVEIYCTLEPTKAAELGYQRTLFWRSTVESSLQVDRIRRAFAEMTEMDYEECPLEDIVDDISRQYAFDFSFDENTEPGTLVTIDVRDQRLASALDAVAEKVGLVVCVLEDSVKLLPKNHAKAKSTLTYNVRGLVNEDVTLDSLAKLVGEQIDKDSKVWKMGKYSIVAKALESDQRKISRVLGSLSLEPSTLDSN